MGRVPLSELPRVALEAKWEEIDKKGSGEYTQFEVWEEIVRRDADEHPQLTTQRSISIPTNTNVETIDSGNVKVGFAEVMSQFATENWRTAMRTNLSKKK